MRNPNTSFSLLINLHFRINPERENKQKLVELSEGVSSAPIAKGETAMAGFDALHAMLSFGRWILKIICHLNAGLTVWKIEGDMKSYVEPIKEKLKSDMLQILGEK